VTAGGRFQWIEIKAEMDAILNASVLCPEEEVLAELQECCEAEAETPGHQTERLQLAAEDLCQMLERQNRQA
jgi:hypothetical protein